MKIGIVSQWYDPEVGSPAVIGTVARALLAEGHAVQVLTGYPNYPVGRVYDGYRLGLTMQEQLRDIPVRRVWLYPSHDESPVRRCLNYLSFALTASVCGVWNLRKVDVLLVFCSPVTVGLPGALLRWWYGIPLVLFVQDIWPETVWASGMGGGNRHGAAGRLLRWFCEGIYRSADRVAVITPAARQVLAEKGVAPERTDLVYNWVDEQVYAAPTSTPTGSPFVILYAGSVGHVQGLDVAIRALAQVAGIPDLCLSIVGGGVAQAELVALAQELGVADRVVFRGPVVQAEAARLMALAHVQLISLRDLPVFRYTLPSKVQASLAAGVPMVGMVAGDAALMIEQAGAGLVSAPGDVDALAAAFEHVYRLPAAALAQMGRSGRAYYERELTQAVGVARLEDVLVRACGPGRVSVGA